MLLGEAVEHRRLEVEDADHAVLVHERHHELGAGLRHQADVARVLPHVAHQDRLAAAHRRAAQALRDRDAAALLAGPEVDRLAQHELVPLLVQQEDAEHLVVDHALDDLRQPPEQLVEVEDRGRFLPDLVERREEPRVPARLAVERRVLDRHREVPGQDLQRGARGGGEGRGRGALDVQDAHQVVLAHERDRELGHDAGEERDVARVQGRRRARRRAPARRRPPPRSPPPRAPGSARRARGRSPRRGRGRGSPRRRAGRCRGCGSPRSAAASVRSRGGAPRGRARR